MNRIGDFLFNTKSGFAVFMIVGAVIVFGPELINMFFCQSGHWALDSKHAHYFVCDKR